MAFSVKDKNDNVINIQDTVNVLVTEGLDFGDGLKGKVEVFATVIEILSETEIKCMPIEEGLPFNTDPKNTTIASSIVRNIIDAAVDKDFQAIMADAETRLANFSKAKATKRKGKGGAKKNARPELEAQINMDILK